jgi:transmembrane sensor
VDPNLSNLFNRLLEGTLSPEEAEVLVNQLGTDEPDPELVDLIRSQLQKPVAIEEVDPKVLATLKAKLPLILAQSKAASAKRIPLMQSRWLRYAAAILLLFGAGSLLLLKKSTKPSVDMAVKTLVKEEITPGKEGAILTLDDGRTVVLDSLGNAVISNQNGTKVQLKNGRLIYENGQLASSEITYNTMTTPKGRQFQVLLPDGSNVWLNAASSIRFPTVFAGTERMVEVTGEAYFEVAKNTTMPFRVRLNNETEIKVTGTHFNVNSYSNEAQINATLLEGSIQILNGGQTTNVRPGQQAQVAFGNKSGSTAVKIINDVNVEKVVAWKNGVFDFQDATLEEVMRQLERWYNIDVVYEKGIPKLEFFGKMGRDLNLPTVLNALEKSKVHFRMEEGRKLVVLP